MTSGESVLVWFRRDLRLADHPALTAAAATGLPIVPVFLWNPEDEGQPAPGAASRWWLHQSLQRLDESLRALGSRLILRCGPVAESLTAIAGQIGARRVFLNHVYEPAAFTAESAAAAALRIHGIAVEGFDTGLLFPLDSIRTTSGDAFRVFTPFWRSLWNQRGALGKRLPPPAALPAPSQWPSSVALQDLGLEPAIDWTAGLRAAWTPGESAALTRLHSFAKSSVSGYTTERDRPDHDGTSRLSPHLHFGEITPLQIWHAVSALPGAESYLRQLAWRDFAHQLLCASPQSLHEPWNPRFRHFPWRRNQRRLRAWQRGVTGYPLVDAAMRQLWTTGWMHNRARMVVASFLVKHLLIPWQDGAAWFLDTLVDADLANNTMGWQWVAGCGADPAPYFRIFNPVTQGEKFDPDGDYVRRWVPELRDLPSQWIHQPWADPQLVLGGFRPGETYAQPIVDHAAARVAALAAFAEMKAASAAGPD